MDEESDPRLIAFGCLMPVAAALACAAVGIMRGAEYGLLAAAAVTALAALGMAAGGRR